MRVTPPLKHSLASPPPSLGLRGLGCCSIAASLACMTWYVLVAEASPVSRPHVLTIHSPLPWVAGTDAVRVSGDGTFTVQNDVLVATFDSVTGTLQAVKNVASGVSLPLTHSLMAYVPLHPVSRGQPVSSRAPSGHTPHRHLPPAAYAQLRYMVFLNGDVAFRGARVGEALHACVGFVVVCVGSPHSHA